LEFRKKKLFSNLLRYLSLLSLAEARIFSRRTHPVCTLQISWLLCAAYEAQNHAPGISTNAKPCWRNSTHSHCATARSVTPLFGAERDSRLDARSSARGDKNCNDSHQ
jgi:hypothetical protein